MVEDETFFSKLVLLFILWFNYEGLKTYFVIDNENR